MNILLVRINVNHKNLNSINNVAFRIFFKYFSIIFVTLTCSGAESYEVNSFQGLLVAGKMLTTKVAIRPLNNENC